MKLSFNKFFVLIALLALTFGSLGVTPAYAAGLVVNSNTDDTTVGDGNCTLREAINNANGDSDTTSGDCAAGSGADTITFHSSLSGTTITLGSTLATVTTDITIDGSALASPITIDGASAYRQFFVSGASAVLGLTDLVIANGSSCNGGAILSAGNATVNIMDSTFTGNADSGCAASVMFSNGTTNITNSTFYNNSSTGGSLLRNGAGTLTIKNSTITGNTVGTNGVLFTDSGTNLYLYNSTITQNTSGIGNADGIFVYLGNLYLYNTIVYENDADSDCFFVGGTYTNVKNLDSDGTCSAGVMSDPMLSALADNGGETMTMALGSSSPAVDAGQNATCQSTDQRGESRPVDGDGNTTATCDIGAYEFIPVPPAAPTVSTDSIETLQDRRVNATLSSLGSPASVSAYGVVFNTTGTPTTSDSKVNKATPGPTTTGAYTVGLDEMNLTAGTKYYVRAFATNDTGTSYGDELVVYGTPGDFTHIAPANDATDVSTSPTLSWNASTGATDYEYCVQELISDCASDFFGPNWISTGGATSADLSGLSSGTNYVWAVRAVVGTPASYRWVTGAPFNFTTVAAASPSTLVVRSNAANDGWVLESAEASNTGGSMNSAASTLVLGDDGNDREYRAILHFDTSALPDNAVVTSVILKIKQSGSVAGTNPFNFSTLHVDMRKPSFGNALLELLDFNFAAKKVNSAVFNSTPVGGWYNAHFNNAGKVYLNRTGATQLRLYFSTGDNNNSITDFIRFYSGNSAAGNRPKLIITYTLP